MNIESKNEFSILIDSQFNEKTNVLNSKSEHTNNYQLKSILNQSFNSPLHSILQKEILHFLNELNFQSLTEIFESEELKANFNEAFNSIIDFDSTISQHNNSYEIQLENHSITSESLLQSPHSLLKLNNSTNLELNENYIYHPLLTSEFNFHLSSYVSIVQSFIAYLNDNYNLLIQFVTKDRSFDLEELWKGNILQEMWQKIGILRMNADRAILSLSAFYYHQYNEYLDIYQDIYNDMYIDQIGFRRTDSRRKLHNILSPSTEPYFISPYYKLPESNIQNEIVTLPQNHYQEQIPNNSNISQSDFSEKSQTIEPISGQTHTIYSNIIDEVSTPPIKNSKLAHLANRIMLQSLDSEKSILNSTSTRPNSRIKKITDLMIMLRKFSIHYKWKIRIEKMLMIASSSFWLFHAITNGFRDLKIWSTEWKLVYIFLGNLIRFRTTLNKSSSNDLKNIFKILWRAFLKFSLKGIIAPLFSIILIKLLMSSIYINHYFYGDEQKQSIMKINNEIDTVLPINKSNLNTHSLTKLTSWNSIKSIIPQPPQNETLKILKSYKKNIDNTKHDSIILNNQKLSNTPPIHIQFIKPNELSFNDVDSPSIEDIHLINNENLKDDLQSEYYQDSIRRKLYLQLMIQLKQHIQLIERFESFLQQINEKMLFYDATIQSNSNSFVIIEKDRIEFEEKSNESFNRLKFDIETFLSLLKKFPKTHPKYKKE